MTVVSNEWPQINRYQIIWSQMNDFKSIGLKSHEPTTSVQYLLHDNR